MGTGALLILGHWLHKRELKVSCTQHHFRPYVRTARSRSAHRLRDPGAISFSNPLPRRKRTSDKEFRLHLSMLEPSTASAFRIPVIIEITRPRPSFFFYLLRRRSFRRRLLSPSPKVLGASRIGTNGPAKIPNGDSSRKIRVASTFSNSRPIETAVLQTTFTSYATAEVTLCDKSPFARALSCKQTFASPSCYPHTAPLVACFTARPATRQYDLAFHSFCIAMRRL